MPEFMPSFFEDKFVGKTKEALFETGGEFLRGEPSEFFKPIGEIGGQQLTDLIAMIGKDITSSVQGDVIQRGVGRGPAATELISGKMGDISTQLRWQDLLRGLEGRKFLLGEGRGMVTDVGQMGLEGQRQKNTFSMQIANLVRQDRSRKDEKKAQEAMFWSNLVSGGIGGIGNIMSMNMLGDILKES